MNDPVKIVLLVVAAVILYALFFGTILFVIAHLGGWQRLAQSYRRDWPVTGTVYRFRSGRMGRHTNYGSCLKFTVADEGLEIAVLPVFRPGHPPLFFPWDEITVTRERNWLNMEVYVLTFAREPSARLRLMGEVAREIEARAGTTRLPTEARLNEG